MISDYRKNLSDKQRLKIFKLSDLSRDEEDWWDKQTNTIRDGGNTNPTTAYNGYTSITEYTAYTAHTASAYTVRYLPSYIAILLEINGKIASTLLCYISLSSGPKILIFMGVGKIFGIHITEKPPRHLLCIAFRSDIASNGPKMPIFGQKC